MVRLPNLEAIDVKMLDFVSVLYIFFCETCVLYSIVDCSYSLRSYPNGCYRGRVCIAGP